MGLISREEVLGYLQCEVNFWKDEDEKVHKVVDIIKFEIEELPIIESRPKGKWEVTSTFPREWICSNCGTHYTERLTHKKHNYCAVCGADMRGEE